MIWFRYVYLEKFKMNVFDKLILGTVQLGSAYGINNTHGQLTSSEVNEILAVSYKNGIKNLDTADAYGNSINFIGEFHSIDPKNKFAVYSKPSLIEKKENFEVHIRNSLSRLGIRHFQGYMFHSFQDLIQNKELHKTLLVLKEQGLIKHIGVSVYTNEEICSVVNNFAIDFIQFPYNVFDNWSFKKEEILLLKKHNIEVHVRSIFLQGLFFMNIEEIPQLLSPFKKSLILLKKISIEENIPLLELLFSYVIYNKYIDKVLFGVDNIFQLNTNISIFKLLKENIFLNQKLDNIIVECPDLLNIKKWK